jgi:hypothetical protein
MTRNISVHLKDVIAWLERKQLVEPVRKELVRMASKRPSSTLRQFVENIDRHIALATEKVK